MNPTEGNKLMPYLQAAAAGIIIILFCATMVAPMLGYKSPEQDMKEVLKNIMFILMGFLFGSSVDKTHAPVVPTVTTTTADNAVVKTETPAP